LAFAQFRSSGMPAKSKPGWGDPALSTVLWK